ncbi:hypothetical protein V7O66_05540 [Methanolobus sp. ZRKC3]|uniref:hypothetical protein n=1 Tax=Methanolobus sp. ZRKC3 TaxID=3125786 RepID=UPI0032525A4F
MTDDKTKEQKLNAIRAGKDIGNPLVQNIGGQSIAGGCDVTPGLGLEYHAHKSQGLQSPSDMWIDKSRLTETLSKDKLGLDNIKKLSRQ